MAVRESRHNLRKDKGVMRESIRKYYDSIRKDRKARKKWYVIIACLAAVAVCSTSYALMKPAVTMEKNSKCGLTEHVHDDSCYEDGNLICELPEHEHSEACSTEKIASAVVEKSERDVKSGKSSTETSGSSERVMKYETDDLIVRATVTEKAKIPESAELKAKEIGEGTAEWGKLYKKASSRMKLKDPALFCRFLDISFMDGDKEIEPSDAVDVQITYKDEKIKGLEKGDTNVVHFADDGIEILKADAEITKKGDTQFEYSQDSFSVVGMIVTGDFDLKSGSYIFYDQRNDGKEIFALGVSSSGAVISIPVTVSSDGYVSLDETRYNAGQITWSYDGNSLYNKYYRKYLQLNVGGTNTTTSVLTSTQRVEISGVNISNLTFFCRNYTVGNTTGAYYLGFNEDTASFYTSKYLGHEYRDYLITAKAGTPSEIGLKDTDLSINETIKADGCIKPVMKGSHTVPYYNWYRSKDGKTWEKVERKKITGDRYNMDENGKWLNVSLDGGARYYYKAEAPMVDGYQLTTPVASNPYRIPYYDSLQNGSFEKPVVPPSSIGDDYQPFFPNNTAGMVWKTTAKDSEIEFISTATSLFQQYSQKWHCVEKPADGKQYVELNAKMAGALYQDVLTIPDSTMYWKLAHRGRGSGYMSGESDTMYVVIMSTDLADRYGITTQEKVQDVVNNPNRYPGAAVKKITSDNKSWHYYTSAYKVPEGQYMSRYFFIAGPTAFDNKGGGSTSTDPNAAPYTVGNHLDDISFSTDVPAPTPGKANLVVNKEIRGLSESDARKVLSNLTFRIGSQTVRGSSFVNFTKKDEKIFTASYVVREISDLGSRNIEEVASSAKYDGYTNTISASADGGTMSSGSSVSVTLKEDQTSDVSFLNTYKREGADLTVEKTDERNQPLSGAKFRLSKKNGSKWDYVMDFAPSGNNGSYKLEGLEYDALYRVEEITPPDEYVQLTESIYFRAGKSSFTLCDENGKALSDEAVQEKKAKFLYTPYGTLKIINKKGYVLPETGGEGTHLYMLAGAILILGSALYMGCVSRRRKKEVS